MSEDLFEVARNCLPSQGSGDSKGQLLSVPKRRHDSLVFCEVLANSGAAAAFAVDEFFHADIRNPHTRRAYRQAVGRFLSFVQSDVQTLAMITPAHVGRYFDQLDVSSTTKKLHLSALRHFFDRMVNRHVIVLNPALTVRGERTSSSEGKTIEIPPTEVRKLIKSIDVSHLVGLRDRLVIALLAFTAARVGAIVKLRIADLRIHATQPTLQLHEKRGKVRSIPIRYELVEFINAYLVRLSGTDPGHALLRTAIGKTKRLTTSAMTAADVRCMLKRRLADAELPNHYSPHSFRVYVATGVMWPSLVFLWRDSWFRAILRHISEPTMCREFRWR
ncbi:Tyrosine recombinase XerC [Fuerstiella marisgermanici]|uniref:Tyrosine recombinase XerC n=1 Tax=Fuerstiella marisgermanici TaxID=1891926 RepID=A0A1P8WGS3_9PLAN|nr:Tyrosine recombinase XerC [Fuerstiella marisgermanici]